MTDSLLPDGPELTREELEKRVESLMNQTKQLIAIQNSDRKKLDAATKWVTKVVDLDYGLGPMDVRQLVLDAREVLDKLKAAW